MAKTTETTLRIRAQNLAGKDLGDVAKEIDHLTESQKKSNTAADLAKRSLGELKDQLAALKTLASDLKTRGIIAEGLAKDKAEIGASIVKLRELNTQLNKLTEQKASGAKVAGLNAEIRKTETAINRTQVALAKQTGEFVASAKSAGTLGINAKRTAESIALINVEAQRTTGLIDQTKNSMNQYRDAVQLSRQALQDQRKAQQEITAEVQRRAAVEAQGPARARAEAEALHAQLQEQIRIREELTRRFLAKPAPAASIGAIGPSIGAETANAQGVARVLAIRERLSAVLARQSDAGKRLLGVDGQLASAARGVASALAIETNSLDRTNKATGLFADTGRKSLSVYQRMRGQILSTAAAYVGLFQVVNLVKSAVTAQQDRRRIELQFSIANEGDVAKSKHDVDFIRGQADRLGIVYEDVAKHYANYKIAAQSVGASNTTIEQSFAKATEVVTGLGLDAQSSERVFTAFVQILGKGKVYSEELRQQLGDSLPGAVAKFARSAGRELSGLDKYLKSPQNRIEVFFKFLDDYAKTTHAAAEANAKTLFAQVNRLTNTWRDFLNEVGKTGTSKELLDVVTKIIEKLKGDAGQKFAEDLSGAFVLLGKIALVLIDHFDTILFLLKAFAATNILKGIFGIAGAMGGAVLKTIEFTAKLGLLGKVAQVAAIGTKDVSYAMQLITRFSGAIGIVTAVAAAMGLVVKQAADAAEELDRFAAHMDALRAASGAAGQTLVNNAAGELLDLRTASANADAALAKAKANLAGAGSHGGFDALLFTVKDLASIEQGKSNIERLGEVATTTKIQYEALRATTKGGLSNLAREARDAAAATKPDAFTSPAVKPDKVPKAKKVKEAKDTANEIRDIEQKAAEELLSIQEQLDRAQLDKVITSNADILSNYQLESKLLIEEMQKRELTLRGTLADAKTKKSPEAAASAQAAIDLLPALQAQQQKLLDNKKTTEEIVLAEKQINDLIARRDELISINNQKAALGLISEADANTANVAAEEASKGAILGKIAALKLAIQELKSSHPDLAAALNVDELNAKLDDAALKTKTLETNVQRVGTGIGKQFAGAVASGMGTFIKGITGGIEGVKGFAQAFKAAKNAFLDWLANFLVGMGEAILQALILRAITNALGTTQGYSGVLSSAVSTYAGSGHTGGIVGESSIGSNPIFNVPAMLFANAPRYHGGGIAGLRPGEMPAILRKGEEVLTRDDPRHVMNGGQAPAWPAPVVDVSIHNSIDSGAVLEKGLNTRKGRRAIFNVIAADPGSFKKVLA